MNAAAGGAALSTTSLMVELTKHGVTSCAVCLEGGPEGEKQALLDACDGRVLFMPLYLWHKKVRSPLWKRPLIELRQLARTGAACVSALRAAAFGERHGAELVHSNTSLTLEGSAIARRLGVGHLWHVRELIGERAPFQLPLRDAALGRYFNRHASVVVANSHATAAHLSPFLSGDKLVVVENGVDVKGFLRREERADGGLIVAMVGNLTSRWKKHKLFVEAASRVSRDLDVEFRIYGHGAPSDPYVAEVLELARARGIADRFQLAGFHANPVEFMRELDVLVHPADGESFGRVVIEAWAASVPVVGVAGGGVGSLVRHGETGLLAAPDDASGLAACISTLARDREMRSRLARNGHAEAVEHYSLERYAERIAALYGIARARPLGSRRRRMKSMAESPGRESR